MLGVGSWIGAVALAAETGSRQVAEGEESGEELAFFCEISSLILGVVRGELLVPWCGELIAFTVGKSVCD